MTEAEAAIMSAVISALIGFTTAMLTIRWSLRTAKMELRASYRAELAKRQIDACEAFWSIFGPTSLTDGEHRIIRNVDSQPILDTQEVADFIDNFQEVFTSKAGLYLSKVTRQKLHDFRDKIIELKQKPKNSRGEVELTPEEVRNFHKLRTAARLALREEVGSTDFNVAYTEFRDYEE